MLAASRGQGIRAESGDARAPRHPVCLPLVRAGVSHQALSPRRTDSDPRQAEEHEQGRGTPERVRSGGVRGAAQGNILARSPHGAWRRTAGPEPLRWFPGARPARPHAPPHLGRAQPGRGAAAGPERRGTAEWPPRGPRAEALVHLRGPGAGRRRGPGAPAAAASCAGAEPGVAHRGGSSGCSGHADPGFIAEPQREGAPTAGRG